MAKVISFADIRQINPANSRDNLTRRASGEDFGAQKARAMAQLGNSIASIGSSISQLQEKRQAAEDNAFLARASLELETDYQGILQKNSLAADAAGTNYADTVRGELETQTPDIIQRSIDKGGFRPSQSAIEKANINSMLAQRRYLVKAGAEEHKRRISHLNTQLDATLNQVAGSVTQTGNLQETLQVGFAQIEANKGVIPADQLEVKKQGFGRIVEQQHVNKRLEDFDFDSLEDDLKRSPSINQIDARKVKGINLKKADQKNMAAVAQTAEKLGYDPVLAAAIGHFESAGTFSTTVGNNKSSAKGIFQFLRSNQKEFGLGKTAESQTEAFVKKSNQEAEYVSGRLGRKLDRWERYLIHFQGPGGATKLLQSDGKKSVASVVGNNVVNANPWMKGKTVNQFLSRVKGEIETRMTALEKAIYPEAKAKTSTDAQVKKVQTSTIRNVLDENGNFVRMEIDEPEQKQEAAKQEPEAVYQYLTPQDRQRLLKRVQQGLANQEQQEELQFKSARDAREREGFELVSKGELTREWLDKNGDELTKTAHNRFQLYLRKNKKSHTTNPETYTNILETLESDPERAAKDAVEAYGQGLLSQTNLNRVLSLSRREQSAEKKYPREVNETRQTLRRVLRPKIRDEVSSKRYMEAVNDFDDFVDEVMESGEKDPKKLRDRIQDRAQKIIERNTSEEKNSKVEKFQMPRFGQVSRDTATEENVNAIIQRTIKAYKAKKITKEEFNNEAKILKRWHDFAKEQAKTNGK